MENPPPRFLGLDIGNCTGWALSDGSKIVGSGVRDFTSESRGRKGVKFYNFLHHIGYVDTIFYEIIMFRPGFKDKETGKWKGGATNDGHSLYNGLLMVMEMYAAGFNIPTFGVHPGTVKRLFCGEGMGAASKEQVCEKAHSMGWRGGQPGTAICHDEADACAVLITQARERGIELGF